MLAIIRLALRRPYTFVVLAILILLVGPLAILRTPTDIFPNINIPVVGIVLNYGGLSPQDMQDRLATGLERTLTQVVDDIEHIETQNYHGVSVIKVFFQGILTDEGRLDFSFRTPSLFEPR